MHINGEIIGNLVPLGIFIYLALILRGNIKTKKNVEMLTKPTIWVKILIYGGVLVFTLLTIIALLGK
jgi:hypothetical protein